MKIEGRREQIRRAIEQGLDVGKLQDLMKTTGATPAEVKSVLDELGDRFERRSDVERLLAMPVAIEPSTGGRRVHQVRAEKRKPWWSGVADVPGTPLHPEPPRDIEVHGERFSKDDVASMLRSLGR